MGNPNSKKGRSVREQVLADYDWSSDYLKGIAQSQGASTKAERKQGVAFSDTDLMKMDYEYKLTQEERAYNEELYNQYQSPAALMRQYQEAGLNPALMYTDGKSIGAPIASSPTSAQGTGPTGEVDPFTMMSNLISLIQGAAQTGSDVNLSMANAEKARSDAELNDVKVKDLESQINNRNTDTELKRIQIKYADDLYQLQTEEGRARIANAWKDLDVKQTVEKLNIANSERVQAETVLTEAKTRMQNLDFSQAEELYPLLIQYQKEYNAGQSIANETALHEKALKILEYLKMEDYLNQDGVSVELNAIKDGTKNQKGGVIANLVQSVAWIATLGVAIITKKPPFKFKGYTL